MAAQDNRAPVIIKRKKVIGGDGHHGGAWKVAYADFVTAMMAFFLLMWLLNATTEKQRKGLADYFSPDIPISRVSGGGDGAFGGSSPFAEDTQVRDGTGASDVQPAASLRAGGRIGVADSTESSDEDQDFSEIENALKGRSGESFVSPEDAKHIITRVTDEGLVVELFATETTRLFLAGSARPTRTLRDLLTAVARASDLTPNVIAVEAHVRSGPVVFLHRPTWQLSLERATEVRQLLEIRGVAERRMQRVTGHADRELAHDNPMSVRNNRVEIIFLRGKQKD